MDYFKVSLFVLLCFLKTFDEATGDCVLQINKDFGVPSPVYLRNDQYLVPNEPRGSVRLKKSQKLLVSCPGSKRFVVLGNDTTEFETLEVTCVTNTTFKVGDWTGPLKDIRCNGQPWFISQPNNYSCNCGGKMHQIGYKISGKFYKLYEACFNEDLLRTVYVKHILTAENRFSQPGSRPNFIEGSLFGKTKMSKVYKLANQKSRLNAILGEDKEKEFFTKNQFLTRGHLAARADFPLRATQRASFHYVNTAPQWMRGNAGDWAALEEAVRRRVQSLNISVVVFTGTDGVFTLEDSRGQPAGIYLDVDDNNNGIVPVPTYFYKLVYDPLKRAATAFVSINSSFYNTTAVNDLTFCNDICEDNPKFNWLKWRQNDGTPSFCCTYNEFVEKINYLPMLKVEDIFY